MEQNNYEPYGEQWKKEINKLPKAAIIEMMSKLGLKLEKASNLLDVLKQIAYSPTPYNDNEKESWRETVLMITQNAIEEHTKQ